jgi:hypothetical protein
MPCERCAGLLIVDLYVGDSDLRLLRCVNCGLVRDPRIDRQRTWAEPVPERSPRITLGRARRRVPKSSPLS